MTPGREAPTQEKLRRFSRAAPQGADNIIAACITNMRHSLEAPLGVGSGVLASPAKRVPATQPPRCAARWLCKPRAPASARRRAEEEQAEAFLPLRATTMAPDSQRDVRAAKSTTAIR